MKRFTMTVLFCLTVGAFACSEPIRSDAKWSIHTQTTAEDWAAVTAGENVALGSAATLRPAPDYAPTHDDGDAVQLVDGKLSTRPDSNLFQDKASVGWAYQSCARIVIDLGKSQSIGRVVARFQTSINNNDVTPKNLNLALSNDGDYFSPVRSLAEKVHDQDNPALTFAPLPPSRAGVHAFVLEAGYQARYVRLDVVTKQHFICDEIAVIAAAGQVQALPPAPEGTREYFDNLFDRRDQYQKLIAPGNLIAGKELQYAPQPNYGLTTDGKDTRDLTDGRFGERTDERIWFEKGAVCWQHSPLVTLFADLESVQPVKEVVVRLLGGGEQGSLRFPDEIRVLLSNDGKDYYLVSDRHRRGLDDLSPKAWDLPEENLAWVHNFRLPVGHKARYVALQIEYQKQFICSDELAVVKGTDNLPVFTPSEEKRVVIVTRGVAFSSLHPQHPICANMPLRTKLSLLDARPGKENGTACKVLVDFPDTVRFVTEGFTPETVVHEGRSFNRYSIPCNRGKVEEFMLQSLLPPGKTDTMYLYGDSGNGPENERKVTYQSIEIPQARQPKRLHISLAWSNIEFLYDQWPNYLEAMEHLGFNCVACFPRYWKEADVAKNQSILQAAREAGFQIIVNESPAGALSSDRQQEETKSVINGKPGEHVCPSYRGQCYPREHESFGQHAAWCRPDYLFYDIEAFWSGSQEAPRCDRCKERYAAGNFKDWDDFRAAMGIAMHKDMKGAIEKALADAGIKQKVIYGSYRTQPITPLNDGLFQWRTLYPDLLQIAMPSLYVAGNQIAVANNISQNRALMQTNDIVPWLSPGTYGEYEPVRTRDMILESFANGARGITYYYYRNFDPLHFKYHAEAVDIVTPIEDLFVDGKPAEGLKCDNDKVKLCGMTLAGEFAVLVSNYSNLPPETKVKVTVPVTTASPVWDLHSRKQIATVKPGQSFEVTLGNIAAHLFYVGNKFAGRIP